MMGVPKSIVNRVNIIIACALALIFVAFWAFLNRPEQEPPWPDRIKGFCFQPMQEGQSPLNNRLPSATDIEADLALLADKTHAIRTYTVDGVFAEIPALAARYDINVTLGAWLDADEAANQREVERLIETAEGHYANVVRIIAGNETVLRGDLTIDQLCDHLDRVRQRLSIPVSTAEPWHVWVKHPELAEHTDYVAVHLLPYWEGVHVDRAVEHIVENVNLLTSLFPGKEIVIAEVGWPSNGRIRHGAVASTANEAAFLRRFLDRAEQEHYTYYVMEAFDQPWKQASEGAVGAYWGVYDVYRQAKFPFISPIIKVPEWRMLATISVGIAVITFFFLLIDSRTLRPPGRSFLACIAFGAATAAVWIVYNYTRQYLTFVTVAVGLLMICGMIGVVVIILAEAHEWAEATWPAQWRRPFVRRVLPEDELPMVSLHVPACNEPPALLIKTLDALAGLDYPRFEVIVVDNNTKDPAVWRPVEDHCRKLGRRFRFFHVSPLAGFKAGALNFALARTSPAAEVVAVIDSDYVVSPDWLRDMAPQFSEPAMAIVQLPQDYRDDGENLFKSMCYAEYQGFFHIGMLTRNERNAIIQHGTMTMVRKSVLEEVGGWAEWCITEDAELGLRIFERGYEATYIPQTYGRGVMPDTFEDFKKQRFRWAYGAVQILKNHAGALFGGRGTRLTRGQRYHFVAGWIHWLADGLNLVFTVAALFWSLAMAALPRHVDPPLLILSVMPLTLFVFKICKMFHLYRTRIGAGSAETLASALSGLSLSHTIAKAMLTGLVTSKKPFFRTPKLAEKKGWNAALYSSREEGLIMVALWLAAAILGIRQSSASLDLEVWVVVLIVQSFPYLSTIIVSLVSGVAAVRPRLPEPVKPAVASSSTSPGKS